MFCVHYEYIQLDLICFPFSSANIQQTYIFRKSIFIKISTYDDGFYLTAAGETYFSCSNVPS